MKSKLLETEVKGLQQQMEANVSQNEAKIAAMVSQHATTLSTQVSGGKHANLCYRKPNSKRSSRWLKCKEKRKKIIIRSSWNLQSKRDNKL